jgi:hypothetical protein
MLSYLAGHSGSDPHLFGLDSSGSLYAIGLPGGSWVKDWPKPPGVSFRQIAVQSDDDPHLFGLDSNGSLYAIGLPGGVWVKDWPSSPGVPLEYIAVQSGPDPHLFGIDVNGSIFAIGLPGGSWIKNWPKPPAVSLRQIAIQDDPDAHLFSLDVAGQMHAIGLPSGQWIANWPTPFPVDPTLISNACDLFCEIFPDCRDQCMAHRDEIIQCIVSGKPPQQGSPLYDIPMPSAVTPGEFLITELQADVDLPISPCTLKALNIVFDVVSLVSALAGFNMLRKRVQAGELAQSLIDRGFGAGLKVQIETVANATSAWDKAKAIGSLFSGTSNIFKEVFGIMALDVRSSYSWWQFSLTTISALATISAWFASAGVMLVVQVLVAISKTAELTLDCIDYKENC